MIIKLSPQRRDDTLIVSRSGDILTINGDPIDFSVIPDGASLPADAVDNPWVVGTVERVGGVLHVTVILPHGPNPPQHIAFPEPIHATTDGVVYGDD